MSQSEAPKVYAEDHHVSYWFSGWRDEDFYRIKLVVDKVDGRGFWYYLFHLMEALRDFVLWLKFRKAIHETTRHRHWEHIPRASFSIRLKNVWAKFKNLFKREPKPTVEVIEVTEEDIESKLKELTEKFGLNDKPVDEKEKKE